MSRVRVVFMGTPEFAAPSLQTLIDDEHYEIAGVITQPDRPAGRKLELRPSPVKVLAQQHGLPVLSPEKINLPENLQIIKDFGAEVGVVVAFGQLLSRSLLNLFPFGCVNVHGSLLPRWRGAAPMQRALMAGDQETGVCLQKMVFELDAGDVLGERRLTITPEMDARDLHGRLSQLAGELLHVELMDFVRGNLVGKPQDAQFVTLAPKIKKEDARVDWSQNANAIFNHVRGLTLGPVAFTTLAGARVKVWQARLQEAQGSHITGEVGAIKVVDGERMLVECGGRTWLELLQVQPESKKAMPASEFLRGHHGALTGKFE